MIEIYINGKAQQTVENQTVEQLLADKDFQPPYAVMLNQQHIVRRDYATTKLNSADRIDVIVPMQGG